MRQISDWAEEQDAEAIIEVLPELNTPEQYYEAVLCLGYVYLNQDEYEVGGDWLRKVEEQGKTSGVWNYRMAVAMMHQLNLEEALLYAEQAVQVEPEYPWGWLVYGKVLYGQERKDEAVSAAKKGLELVPENDEFIMLIDEMLKDLPFVEVAGIGGEDTSDSEESKVGSFCGSVLLDSVGIDLNGIMSDLKEEWGIVPTEHPGDSDEGEGGLSKDGTTMVFYVKDAMVAISLFPAKVPDGEAEYFAGTNYMWNDAVKVTKKHEAHVLVAVIPHDMSPVEAGKLYVKVVTACLKQHNAIGVYTSGTVFQPEFYREVADVMKDDATALPILDWIYFGLYQNEEGNNVYTHGMTAFGKDEMEILGSKQDLTELQSFLFEIACYVIDSDVTLEDGETLGVSEEQRLPITRSKGVSVEGDSLKIAF